MATPYKSNGTDFDDIFEPIGSETKAANVGYAISGVDISNRYYPLSAGGSSPSITGYRRNGTDLNQIFAAKGSVSYGPGFEPAYTASEQGTVVYEVDVSLTLALINDLSWIITESYTNKPSKNHTGTWANGVASHYEVRVIVNTVTKDGLTGASNWEFESQTSGTTPWTSPWYIMTEDRYFTVSSHAAMVPSTLNSISVNFTLEIREVLNPSNITSETVTFTVTAENT